MTVRNWIMMQHAVLNLHFQSATRLQSARQMNKSSIIVNSGGLQ